MKSLRERVEVEQAYLDGKSIEYTSIKIIGTPYCDCEGEPTFNWVRYDFRIKPEPIVIWVNIYDKNDCFLHKSQSKALIAVTDGCKRKAVKFVEEIE